jgi:hypothetical protein
VFSLIPSHLPLSLRSPRTIAALSVGAATAIGLATYAFTRKRPTAEEIERERRDLIARTGRITDGTIMDTVIAETSSVPTSTPDPATSPSDSTLIPQIIVYNYRIAGVTYECAQDVTTLAEHVRGIRSDLPIQVRYAPHNPANSIVVAESWSGLRLSSSHPHPANSITSGPSNQPMSVD